MKLPFTDPGKKTEPKLSPEVKRAGGGAGSSTSSARHGASLSRPKTGRGCECTGPDRRLSESNQIRQTLPKRRQTKGNGRPAPEGSGLDGRLVKGEKTSKGTDLPRVRRVQRNGFEKRATGKERGGRGSLNLLTTGRKATGPLLGGVPVRDGEEVPYIWEGSGACSWGRGYHEKWEGSNDPDAWP